MLWNVTVYIIAEKRACIYKEVERKNAYAARVYGRARCIKEENLVNPESGKLYTPGETHRKEVLDISLETLEDGRTVSLDDIIDGKEKKKENGED